MPTVASFCPDGENASCTTAPSWKPTSVWHGSHVSTSHTSTLGLRPHSPVATSRRLGCIANETMSSVCAVQ